ncbi:MAG: hypothetical protein ABI587_16345 [Gemmatimonadales bacterium]
MSEEYSRREWLTLMSIAGGGALLGPGYPGLIGGMHPSPGSVLPVLPLGSTSEVHVPPRGASFQQFSFDFPEPSVELGGYRFGFRIFSRENVYGLDQAAIRAEPTEDGLLLRCDRLVWAGGQEVAPGRLTARFRLKDDAVEWEVAAELGQPIKSITTIVRGLPRGKIAVNGGAPFDPGEDELLYGYPFGAGDLFGGNTAQGISTPFISFLPATGPVLSLTSLDDRVRAKRFYLQPGEQGYRVEAIFEAEGWRDATLVTAPTWRLSRTDTLEQATERHYDHLAQAHHIPAWETRPDVPAWLRSTRLVLTLHGMHYTGFVFNDFARMLEILRWTAERIPGKEVLVFLPAWDGRYYWDYPGYEVASRLGGEAGLKQLVREGHDLGFRFMPMFGANAANRRHPAYRQIAAGVTQRLDGGAIALDWVDWDNDRHQEGWLAYMNLGVPAWRAWLAGRITDAIERFGVDGYFLDISGGWINNPTADMHEGLCTLVSDIRQQFPDTLACGEFHYDALLACLPLFHVYNRPAARFARFFSHLSHPAPGRGSTGVHEAGFGAFDPATLSLREGTIATLNVVDDTFSQHRDVMEAVIRAARSR